MNLHRVSAALLLMAAFSVSAFAGAAVPEIDTASASGAMVLVGGVTLIIRSRLRRKQ